MGFSWTRDWPVPCIGRQILNNWTTREVDFSPYIKWDGSHERKDNDFAPQLVPLSPFNLVIVPPSLKSCLYHLPSLTSICLPFHCQLHLFFTSPPLSHLVFLKKVVVVQLLSCVWLFVTPWTAARQDSLSFTISQSLLKLMSIESVVLSNHLILCHPLILLPSVFASIRVFSNESALFIRWPKYWSFSFSISPSNECSGLISFRIDWFVLLSV